ncbi:hypothetical protein VTJ83DRAFT_2647 [Remersonia thermophila]|uniref:Uncharacterized protein n=1 Tax=Remersonia thermophila TaxID=72144 RepID=A0ABR4DJA9_9PEZI
MLGPEQLLPCESEAGNDPPRKELVRRRSVAQGIDPTPNITMDGWNASTQKPHRWIASTCPERRRSPHRVKPPMQLTLNQSTTAARSRATNAPRANLRIAPPSPSTQERGWSENRAPGPLHCNCSTPRSHQAPSSRRRPSSSSNRPPSGTGFLWAWLKHLSSLALGSSWCRPP